MKTGEVDFKYAEKIAEVKWFHARNVTFICTRLEAYNKISSASQHMKGQSRKLFITFT